MRGFSIIIPAHNEEAYIGRCIHAAWNAVRAAMPCRAEVIVVTNACTDRTAEIARRHGARVIDEPKRCIAAVRNTGARAARGDILMTVDADSLMTPDTLCEVRELLGSGKYIGGGTNPKFDRMSLGIAVSAMYVAWNLLPVMRQNGCYLSGAMFWCRKEDFDAAGGFDETLVSLEDMDFARRLKQRGDALGKRYGTLRRNYVLTSSRKFDEFGDWYLVKDRALTRAIFTGHDREAADRFYYNVR